MATGTTKPEITILRDFVKNSIYSLKHSTTRNNVMRILMDTCRRCRRDSYIIDYNDYLYECKGTPSKSKDTRGTNI